MQSILIEVLRSQAYLLLVSLLLLYTSCACDAMPLPLPIPLEVASCPTSWLYCKTRLLQPHRSSVALLMRFDFRISRSSAVSPTHPTTSSIWAHLYNCVQVFPCYPLSIGPLTVMRLFVLGFPRDFGCSSSQRLVSGTNK